VENGKRKMRKRNEKGEIVSGEKKMEWTVDPCESDRA
jgi:hypothetical protein